MIGYFNIGWLVLWFIITHAFSLNFVLCLCHGRTNMDSFNVLFIVNSYSLLKHFSKQKAGDLISYTFLWTASMLIPNAFKDYFISCKRLLIKCSKHYDEYNSLFSEWIMFTDWKFYKLLYCTIYIQYSN